MEIAARNTSQNFPPMVHAHTVTGTFLIWPCKQPALLLILLIFTVQLYSPFTLEVWRSEGIAVNETVSRRQSSRSREKWRESKETSVRNPHTHITRTYYAIVLAVVLMRNGQWG